MVQYRRNLVPGGTFFFTVVLHDRQEHHLVENIDVLRGAFRTVRRETPFAVDAIAVLPDHLHAIFTLPPGDYDFPSRWRRIKALFTRGLVARGAMLLKNSKGEYDLWQRRYWEHTIRDTGDFERHVDYIHFNPVRHGLVGRTSDWPYSSFRRYVKEGLLPLDWGGTADENGELYGERLG